VRLLVHIVIGISTESGTEFFWMPVTPPVYVRAPVHIVIGTTTEIGTTYRSIFYMRTHLGARTLEGIAPLPQYQYLGIPLKLVSRGPPKSV
jgi:hypothetical protein